MIDDLSQHVVIDIFCFFDSYTFLAFSLESEIFDTVEIIFIDILYFDE